MTYWAYWAVALVACFVLFLLIGERSESADEDDRSHGPSRAPFECRRMAEAVHMAGAPYVLKLPGWHSYPHVSGIADFIAQLSPDQMPVALVLYGSAVRKGRSANDVDVAFVIPGYGEPKFGHIESKYTYDDYGACTRRGSMFHAAFIPEEKLRERLRNGDEWAVTLFRDGVLLAGELSGISKAFYEKKRGGDFRILRIGNLSVGE